MIRNCGNQIARYTRSIKFENILSIRVLEWLVRGCSYGGELENKTSEKQNKTEYRKLYPTLPDWLLCAYSYGKVSSNLGEILEKSNDIPSRQAGFFLI